MGVCVFFITAVLFLLVVVVKVVPGYCCSCFAFVSLLFV